MKKFKILLVFVLTSMMISSCIFSAGNENAQIESFTWELDLISDNSPILNSDISVKFESGEISGRAGCNHYGGNYQLKGNNIQIDAIFQTEMACHEPVGIMEQELKFLDLLAGSIRFKLNDDNLTLIQEHKENLVFGIRLEENPLVSGLKPLQFTETPVAEDVLVNATSSLTPVATPEDITIATPISFIPPHNTIEYQDLEINVSVFLPESWIVTEIVNGQSAIFQSYPANKYVGGGDA